MTVFISGGGKSGKSGLAQELSAALADGGKLYYVATMIPTDEEDKTRILLHVKDRAGMGFETIECGKNILSCLDNTDKSGTFLLDSVTALLMNELFPVDKGYEMDADAAYRCAEDLEIFSRSAGNAVFVSDYIYSDAARYDNLTERYRKYLAYIDRKLAQICDTVIEASYGNYIVHKGELPE